MKDLIKWIILKMLIRKDTNYCCEERGWSSGGESACQGGRHEFCPWPARHNCRACTREPESSNKRSLHSEVQALHHRVAPTRKSPHAAMKVQRSHKKKERGNIAIKPTDMKKILRGYCRIEFCVLQIHKLMP